MDEYERIRLTYAARDIDSDARYHPFKPDVYLGRQERERLLIRKILSQLRGEQKSMRVLEIGCGSGQNLLEFVSLGYAPQRIVGVELLEERAALAKQRVPEKVRVIAGNVLEMELGRGSFDVIFQSTVFTSILDWNVKKRLAKKMLDWLAPRGVIIWYDFRFDNPRNRAVKGVSAHEIKELFEGCNITLYRSTLAPPLARAVCRVHPALYGVANSLPFLRTHLLGKISMPTE